jgi:hypothetical protein
MPLPDVKNRQIVSEPKGTLATNPTCGGRLARTGVAQKYDGLPLADDAARVN